MAKRKTTLITQYAGKLVRDPEVRQAGESEIIFFSIPWNNTNRDGEEYVHWIQARCWSNHPLFPVIREYCKKGTGIMVSGRLAIERYTKNNTGEVIDGFVLHIDTLVLVSQPNETSSETPHRQGDADEGLESPDTYTPVTGKKGKPVPPATAKAKGAVRTPKRPPADDGDDVSF